MAKRQNFIVGQDNPVTDTSLTDAQLKAAWDMFTVLKAGKLNGIFNAVSGFSKINSDEISNAILSITGSEPTGNSSDELAQALQLMRQEIETSSLTFKGFIATSAPSSSTYSLEVGNIWINSATLPTTFPATIAGVWDGSQWASTTDTYSPADFDFFRNINDGEGYYWFGGQWTVMSTDLDTTYFTLNQNTGKWEIKNSVELPGTPTVETEPDINDTSKKIATTAWARNLAAPVGTIVAFGGTTAPTGWLICDGSAISRTTYADLFAVIGTAYGTGDGSTTFNLPNGKMPLGTSAPVIGNGQTISFYDGTSYLKLSRRDNDNTVQFIGTGTTPGSVTTNRGLNDHATNAYALGVTTNPNNSGLIADLTSATAASWAIIKY